MRIIPFLVAILAAVGAFRGAGAMDALAKVLAPVTGPLGLPAEVLPMALVRPLSGSGALGLLGNIFATPGLGPDSYAGRLGSVLQGSTETTFYVLSVYCGSAGIVRYRHALAAGLLADFTGLTASVIIARTLSGAEKAPGLARCARGIGCECGCACASACGTWGHRPGLRSRFVAGPRRGR